MPERPPTRPRRRGPSWPTIRDALAFLLGNFILLWQTVAEENPNLELVLAGFACLGITGSSVAQRFLTKTFLSDDAEAERHSGRS